MFDRAEVLIESDSSISGRAKIYTNKGKTLLEVGLLSEAKFSLKKAIEIDEKAKKVFGLTYSYCQLASLYKKEGHLDTSKTYVLKSLKCAQKTSNKLMEGVAYKMLGEIYETNGNIKKAISWVEKSCAIQVELGDQIEIMRTNASLGDLYFKLGDYKKSEQFTKIAYKGAMKSGFKEGQANSALTLSKLNERKGAYEDALVYYREANDIFEKIGGGKVAKEIAVLEYQHSLEQSELEKQNVQVAMALQEESHKSQVLLFLLIILVGLGLALATYVGFKTYKQKAEDKEVYLNKMLSTKALQVVSNANLFNNVNDIIKKGSESFPEVHKDQLRSVQADIKTAIDSNAWKEFELAFNGVNKGFYKNLEKDFPNLTKNERKLCAFLRMDLSTKDISNITFQSKHSIDIARSRLRKKLGLSNNQTSLYSFLRSY